MLNKLVLIGRLTKSPELRYTPSGVAVTNFTLAVDRSFKNAQGEKETDFIPCVVYKQLAELCAKYLDKGKLCSIDGRLQIRTYNDKDGQKHWVTECIGENIDFLSPKDDNGGQAPAPNPPTQQQPQTQQQGHPGWQGQQPPNQGQPQTQGYGQPPQGQWQGQPPGQQPPPPVWGQPPHPNMPNPNMPPAQWLGGNPPQNPPGAAPSGRFGHEVSLDDDIPF